MNRIAVKREILASRNVKKFPLGHVDRINRILSRYLGIKILMLGKWEMDTRELPGYLF